MKFLNNRLYHFYQANDYCISRTFAADNSNRHSTKRSVCVCVPFVFVFLFDFVLQALCREANETKEEENRHVFSVTLIASVILIV